MLELAVVILSNETEFNFGVLIREDTIVEDTESFAAILQLPPGTVPGDSLEANVFILDNDGESFFLWICLGTNMHYKCSRLNTIHIINCTIDMH